MSGTTIPKGNFGITIQRSKLYDGSRTPHENYKLVCEAIARLGLGPTVEGSALSRLSVSKTEPVYKPSRRQGLLVVPTYGYGNLFAYTYTQTGRRMRTTGVLIGSIKAGDWAYVPARTRTVNEIGVYFTAREVRHYTALKVEVWELSTQD